MNAFACDFVCVQFHAFCFFGFFLVGPQFNMTSCVIFGSAPATCGLPSFVCSCSVFIQETL